MGIAGDGPRVVVLAYEGLWLFEFSIAVNVFALRRPEVPTWYRCAIAGTGTSVGATGGVRVGCEGGLDLLDRADLVVIPGWNMTEPGGDLVAALRRATQRGSRIMSICSGAFLLAGAGLLDGRQATTHWLYADRFESQFPRVKLVRDVLYVDEGDVLSSAGSAAGIDLCLHVVRKDYGVAAANMVARRMVVAGHRDGGQQQFIERPVPRDYEGTRLSGVIEGLRARPDDRISVAELAARAGMSERTFIRRFKETMGIPPHQWVVRERVARARELLELGSASMEEIARLSGFTAPALMRKHFFAQVGLTPVQYRRRFGDAQKPHRPGMRRSECRNGCSGGHPPR
jgi:AraC family transcriptional activator FtrA